MWSCEQHSNLTTPRASASRRKINLGCPRNQLSARNKRLSEDLWIFYVSICFIDYSLPQAASLTPCGFPSIHRGGQNHVNFSSKIISIHFFGQLCLFLSSRKLAGLFVNSYLGTAPQPHCLPTKSNLVAAAGIHLHPQSGHRYIKWNAFPDHVWDRGVYIRLPREIIFESPDQTVEERIRHSLHAPWTEENVQIMKAALDLGEVKVLNRPSGMFHGYRIFPATFHAPLMTYVPCVSLGRNIIFECFDQNRKITEVGRWSKLELNTHRRIRRLKLRKAREGNSDIGSSMGESRLP